MIMKFLFIIIICLVAGFIWLLQPYMQREYVRISNSLTTIEAEYITVTGDPLCTNFYRVEGGKISNNGIFPNMPEDIPDPHSLTEFKDGDRVKLTGFLYQWRETNLITGAVSTRQINMIDVLGWQSSASANYQSKQADTSPGAFRHENYTNCRP